MDYQIEKGIKFHNGKQFVAEDAVYSLLIHSAKGSKSGAKGLLANWKDVTTSGKHAIKIHLNSADQDLPWVLNDYHLQMLPKDFNDWTKPIGTNGYKLKRFQPGVSAKFVRKGNHWKPNTCHFDKIHLISLSDPTARLNALMSGQVDVINSVPPKNAKRLGKKSNIDLVLSTTGMYYNNPMIVNQKPFTDNNVRLAMKFAVDRQKILDKVLLGYGVLGNDQPISAGDEFYNPNIKQRPYDPDKSKYYLKKAGLSKLKVDLHTSNAAYAGAVDASVVMKESMKSANINLNVVRAPNDGYWSNTWMKKSFTSCYWGRRPTSALTFATTYLSGAAWNDTFYANPKFDKLLKTLQSSRNRDTRKSASWEMQEILHNDGGQIVPMMPQSIDAKSSKVMGHDPHPIYDMNDNRLAEKAWFA